MKLGKQCMTCIILTLYITHHLVIHLTTISRQLFHVRASLKYPDHVFAHTGAFWNSNDTTRKLSGDASHNQVETGWKEIHSEWQ